MWEDPIVKETRAAREELSARFNHDLSALCRYLREKEREHSDRVVTLAPRRPETAEIAKK
jgi:anaerobic selenocysteine-containing dehydrogenase